MIEPCEKMHTSTKFGYDFQKLPNEIDGDLLENDLARLKKQQVVVSNQVLQLILEKQSACQLEFKR